MNTGELCGREHCGHSDEDHWDGTCHFQQHGARLTCDCTGFVSPTIEAIKALSPNEQRLLACANFLGIDPDYIANVENAFGMLAGETKLFGFKVCVHIGVNHGSLWEWVMNNLPKWRTAAATAYLAKRAETKKHNSV